MSPSIRKSFIFILFSILIVNTNVFAQCSTYVQMTDIGIEGCSLPVIVATQEILFPCSSPAGFWDLEKGEFAYIDYTLTGCFSFCQVGEQVDITCFSVLTDIDEDPTFSKIKLYPTVAESIVYIDGQDIQRAEFYDTQGRLVITKHLLNAGKVDISVLPIGMYYIRLMIQDSFAFFPLLKI